MIALIGLIASIITIQLYFNDNVDKVESLTPKNGLTAIFYKEDDTLFEKPIDETILNQGLSLFGKKFTDNKKLQEDTTYKIRITGFLYSPINRYATYKIKEEVYNIEVKINDKPVLNEYDKINRTPLNAGSNYIEIIFSSQNSYDIELLEKQKNDTFSPIAFTQLFIKK